MNSQKPTWIKTGCLGGGLLLLFLSLFPVALKTWKMRALESQFKVFKMELADELEFPPITYENNELHCNDDRPFTRTFEEKGELFVLHIDTSEQAASDILDVTEQEPSVALMVSRDRITIYNQEQSKSETLYLKDIPYKDRFVLNEEKLLTFLEKGVGYFIVFAAIVLFFIHALGKLTAFGILSLYFSSKLKPHGGGNNSLALWTLLPGTLFQGVMIVFNIWWIISFPAYVVVTIISAAVLQDKVLRQLEEAKSEPEIVL